MKTAIYGVTVALTTLLLSGAAMAQTANSGSSSNSNASAGASAGARAGAAAIANGNVSSNRNEARGGNAAANAAGGNASTRYNNPKQAPGFGLAGLAAGGLSCRGSMSVGVSFPGGGFGFGSTTPDDECERRQWAGMLAGAKDRRTQALAWYIMARSTYVQQAMVDAGYGAPVGTAGVAAPYRPAVRAAAPGRAAGPDRRSTVSCRSIADELRPVRLLPKPV